MKFLNIFKFSAKILAFTQFSAYAYTLNTYQNGQNEIIENKAHVEIKKKRSKRALMSINFWDGGKIYYFFDNQGNPHSEDEKNRIRLIIRELEGEANITFEEINDQIENLAKYKSYIRITNIIGDTAAGLSAGCYVTHVGMPEGEGKLNLSSSYILDGDPFSCFKTDEGVESNAPIRHELLHVLGFEHEHMRPEQRENINYNLSSLRKIYQNPEIIQTNLDPLPAPLSENYIIFGGYDFNSVMHYYSYAGASNEAKLNKKPFITKINGELITFNEFLSPNDKFALRKIYGSIPSKVLKDSEGNKLQFCKLYKIDYNKKPNTVGAWKYIISAASANVRDINPHEYQDSFFGIFEPAFDQKLCTVTLASLKAQNIKIHLEIEQNDNVKLKIQDYFASN
ncbi:M12 family metallopeptidase [Fluviispira vulneris]|uniref:M12 family metallopeptidase n=1 Tax=Fluviispira vulneris TaxID=2763012 RepID=UPI001648FB9C|nr:M12 family metallopeptidase [Fluviispira vulneris]